MHTQAYNALGEMIAESGIDTTVPWYVLDFGGRDVNSTSQGLNTRKLLPNARWSGVDIVSGPGVDIVTDATVHPWKWGTQFDLVVCTEMFEHVEKWSCVVANITAALRDGQEQTVFITCAGPGRHRHGASGEDQPPPGEWYQNVSPEELDAELSVYFDHVATRFGPETCDTYGWARGIK